MKNTVLNPYKAVVNGNITALSGCDNTNCTAHCLRKDAQLQTRTLLNRTNRDQCTALIQVNP